MALPAADNSTGGGTLNHPVLALRRGVTRGAAAQRQGAVDALGVVLRRELLPRDLLPDERRPIHHYVLLLLHPAHELTRELCSSTRFSLEKIPVQACIAGAGRMAPPTSSRITACLKCVQRRVSSVKMLACQ